MRIDLSWTELKSICIANKNLFLQYTIINKGSGTYYYIWATEGIIQYISVIEKKETPDAIQLDFETNYKDNCNKAINSREDYIAESIEVTNYDDYLEYDLGKVYTAYTLMIQGENDVIIKLNSIDNNAIPLQGTAKGGDNIGADPFNLSKIYYKLQEEGKNSKILLYCVR